MNFVKTRKDEKVLDYKNMFPVWTAENGYRALFKALFLPACYRETQYHCNSLKRNKYRSRNKARKEEKQCQ